MNPASDFHGGYHLWPPVNNRGEAMNAQQGGIPWMIITDKGNEITQSQHLLQVGQDQVAAHKNSWFLIQRVCTAVRERVCMLPTKQLTYPEETNCLKLNKGPPFRTTIPHVLLHTIFMCVQISIWWTLMSQPVLVTGSPLNTQLRNHPFSWFVYKVCAMHAGWCMCVGVFTSSTKS